MILIHVSDEKYLIPFKAKAWCELIERKKQGKERHADFADDILTSEFVPDNVDGAKYIAY